MPAPRATANRKPPTFKPPRPAKKTTPNKTARASPKIAQDSGTIAGSSRMSKNPSKSSLGKPSNTSRPIQVSDDDNVEEEEDFDEDQDIQGMDEGDGDESEVAIPSASTRRAADTLASPSTVAPLASQDQPPPIPQKLLSRLLHEGLEDSNTKIGKDAMLVLGKYVELFVREAIARAAVEREGETGGGLGDEFLEVSS